MACKAKNTYYLILYRKSLWTPDLELSGVLKLGRTLESAVESLESSNPTPRDSNVTGTGFSLGLRIVTNFERASTVALRIKGLWDILPALQLYWSLHPNIVHVRWTLIPDEQDFCFYQLL